MSSQRVYTAETPLQEEGEPTRADPGVHSALPAPGGRAEFLTAPSRREERKGMQEESEESPSLTLPSFLLGLS